MLVIVPETKRQPDGRIKLQLVAFGLSMRQENPRPAARSADVTVRSPSRVVQRENGPEKLADIEDE